MTVAGSPAKLHLGLLGDFQSIVDLDPEIPGSSVDHFSFSGGF
jgi:hypothetical protein